jgi:hypothetical protein
MAFHITDVSVFSDGAIQVAPYAQEPPPPPPSPARDDLWQLGHSYKSRQDLNGNPVPGMPATWTTMVMMKFKAERLKDMLIWVQCLLHPEMTQRQVEDKIDNFYGDRVAFSNNTGWGTDNFRIQGLGCEGQTVQATVPGPEPEIVRSQGETWATVFAIDPLHPPTIQTLADIDMTRWFFPTTALPTGGNLFPHFDGRVIVPFLGEDGIQHIRWPYFGVTKVGRVMQPAIPARWDATKGLIDP